MTIADDLVAAADKAADELQALAAANADLSAQNAQLRAQLAALTGGTVQYGLNITDWSTLDAHRAMVGGGNLTNIRVFFPTGADPKWSSSFFSKLRGTDRPWVSCKTLTEASFRAFVQTIPAKFQLPGKPIRVTYRHEGEADALKSSDPAAWITDYLSTYATMQRVLASEPNGKWFEPWKILLRYTQAEDTRPGFQNSWPRFVGDQTVPVGMDCYWSGWALDYWPADVLFAPIVGIGAQTGLRIAVPELGGVTVYKTSSGTVRRNDTDGSKRAAALADVLRYLPTTRIESVNWWCGTGAAGDHHLDPYPSNVSVWRQAVTSGGMGLAAFGDAPFGQ